MMKKYMLEIDLVFPVDRQKKSNQHLLLLREYFGQKSALWNSTILGMFSIGYSYKAMDLNPFCSGLHAIDVVALSYNWTFDSPISTLLVFGLRSRPGKKKKNVAF